MSIKNFFGQLLFYLGIMICVLAGTCTIFFSLAGSSTDYQIYFLIGAIGVGVGGLFMFVGRLLTKSNRDNR